MHGIPIEGEAIKPFAVWRIVGGEFYEQEAAYDTAEEVRAHHFRLDRHYKIRIGRKFHDWRSSEAQQILR